jgi:hypothetical protein
MKTALSVVVENCIVFGVFTIIRLLSEQGACLRRLGMKGVSQPVFLARLTPQLEMPWAESHFGASELASLLDGTSAGELIPEPDRHGDLQKLIELEPAALLGRLWKIQPICVTMAL